MDEQIKRKENAAFVTLTIGIFDIEHIGLCSCGAITIDGYNHINKNNFSNSFMVSDEQFLEAKREYDFKVDCCWIYCNHCVNHWGLDLCACGSGEHPKECDRDLDCCGKPYQTIGD